MAEETKKREAPRRKVRVHRNNVDQDNADMIISVCVNDAKNRKKFQPGEEIVLSKAEIETLRNSVEETRLYIPPDSGIYQAKDPLSVARNQYPGMRPELDRVTGQIVMVSRTPNYVIEYVNDE